MSYKKLLPCPFCGGEAEIDCDSRFDNWFVRCTKCFCKTRTFKTERSAILIWNNRKPIKRIVERLNNNFRKVQNDEDLEWNRAIDKTIEIVKEEVTE